MYENYNTYRKTRDLSWRCLIDYNVCCLPVSSIGIAKSAGIKIVKNSAANMLANSEFGISIYQPKKNRWIIVYDDALNLCECRWCVAHELGHIILGHDAKLQNGIHTFYSVSQVLESEADQFALRILAPSCVLRGLNLHTSDEIAQACDIPARYAVKQTQRIAELQSKNKFLTNNFEKEVYKNFKDWINFINKT